MAQEIVAGEMNRGRGTYRLQVEAQDLGYETLCWVWPGPLTRDGYGIRKANGETQLAHIAAYEAVNGPIPNGAVIDHLCRVKACIRSDHLEAVAQAENVRRGRNAKLTQEQVDEMRRLYASGEYVQRELAQRFAISPTSVCEIVNNNRWSSPRPYRKPCSVNGRGRVSDEDVVEIRRLSREEGVGSKWLVDHFGISRQHVYNIVTRRARP